MPSSQAEPRVTRSLVPLAYAAGALVLGFALPRLEHAYFPSLVISGLTPSAAQAIFSSVAAGMMALTGIVFSLAFVMVQFSSAAYSPRLVRWFGRAPIMSHSIGIFTATFLYAIAALAWMGRGESERVPLITTLAGVLFLVASVGFFVHLVGAVGLLEVSRVLTFAGDQGRAVVEASCPPLSGDSEARREADRVARDEAHRLPLVQTIRHAGPPRTLQSVDLPALAGLAERGGAVVVVSAAVGDTVIEGTPLLRVHGSEQALDQGALRATLALGDDRTFEQDPKYAIRLLVDVAIKALSPGINDPSTTVQALDQIEDLLLRLGRSSLESGVVRDGADRARVLYPVPTWEDFLLLAFGEIRVYGANSVQVMRRMRALIVNLIEALPPARQPALRSYLERVDAGVSQTFRLAADQRDALVEDPQGLGLPRARRGA
jgi:uncharacterized membrane protein